MPRDEWWSGFFGNVWPRIQADGYPAERTAAECDAIARLLELPEGARVLGIPCGIGRHSVELARRGFRMVGVDLEERFVEQARNEARRAGVAAEFVTSDMRDYVSSETFDAAFCYFGSFGYFSGDGDARFLRAVARVLAPGGRFLLDIHTLETLLPIFRERDWSWADPPRNSRRVLEERTFDVRTGRIELTCTVLDDEGATTADASIRIYGFGELRALLETAGFEDVEGRDGGTEGPLRVGSKRAAIVARRRED